MRVAPEWRPQPPPPASAAPLISAVRPPVALAAPPAAVPRRAATRHAAKSVRALAAAIPLLLLGALVLGMVVSEVRAQFLDSATLLEPVPVASAPPAVPPAAVPEHEPIPHRPATPRPKPRPPAPGAVTWVPTTREVETRTLGLLADGRPAPAVLLDQRLGLLANNVHIACRRVGQTARFTCRLGVGLSTREWLLTVVVARDGTETLTWAMR